MDKEILVERDIEDGKKLIETLDRSLFQLKSALWFYFTDSEEWRLLLATPLIDISGPRSCYNIIQSVIEDMPQGFGISLDRISVISPKDRLIKLLSVAIRTDVGLSTIRFTDMTINGVFIKNALIYRLT